MKKLKGVIKSAIGVSFVTLTIPRLIGLQILEFENRKLAIVSPNVRQVFGGVCQQRSASGLSRLSVACVAERVVEMTGKLIKRIKRSDVYYS
jgi:hypothetical protein